MKRLIPIFVLVSLFVSLLIFMPRLVSQQIKTEDSPDLQFAPGKIVIRFSKEVSPVSPIQVAKIIQTGIGPVDILCQTFKVHTLRRLFPAPKYPTPDLTRYFVVKFEESMDLDQVVTAFSEISFYVEKAEKVAVLKYFGGSNDPEYGGQWHLDQTNDCDIDAPEAWDIEKGSDSVILAIADSGVEYTHLDLDDNIWINWDEYYGTPGEDDDPNGGNGYIDDFYGWDFDDDDNTPTDTYGHGTHVAGIAAAETNNDTGVAGVAGGWYPGQEGCRIMCLCVGHENVSMDYCAEAFYYATNNGATAINCSWHSQYTEYFKDAIDYALYNDVLIVAAAGNSNSNKCSDPNGNYLSMVPGVLVVAATNQYDKRTTFSNYGPCIDVSAPGKDILSTCIGSPSYCTLSGTSMAAPMVVGLAGLLKSRFPGWNRFKIRDAIVESADPIDVQEEMGSGRINANRALKQDTLPTAPSNVSGTPTSWYQINLNWSDNSDNENGFKIERDSSIIATVPSEVTYYEDKSIPGGGTHTYRIIAYNLAGDSPSSTKDVTIPSNIPYQPYNLHARLIGSSMVKLTWSDNSNNEQGFKIERKSEYEPPWREIDLVGPNVTIYDDQYDFDPDTFYYYRVRAYNPSGNSPYSNIVHVYVPWY